MCNWAITVVKFSLYTVVASMQISYCTMLNLGNLGLFGKKHTVVTVMAPWD